MSGKSKPVEVTNDPNVTETVTEIETAFIKDRFAVLEAILNDLHIAILGVPIGKLQSLRDE